VIHRRGSWRQLDEVEYATLEWGDWFVSLRQKCLTMDSDINARL
jgi:hypothetical protein